MYKFNKQSAFSLAEVLITLVIIGIIAAITVSSVIQSTERQEYVTKLKKAYSVLNQSVYRISIENGYPVGDFSFMEDDDFFYLFAEVINTLKICTKANDGCFTSSYIKTLKGTNWRTYDRVNSLITLDGIAYGWDLSYCSGKGLSTEDISNCIGRFIVDINGERSPNRFGYDVYFFAVVDGKGIVPAGSGNNSADCKRGGDGVTCAAKVLKDSEINYL